VRKRLAGLLTDSATYGAGNVLANLIGFLLLPLYTSYLSPIDYGVLAMLGVIVAVFEPLANLGMTNAVFRRFNVTTDEDERRLVLSTALVSVSFTAIILGGASMLAASTIGTVLLGITDHRHLVDMTICTAVVASIGAVPHAALRAKRRVRQVAGLNLLRVVLSVTLTVWLVMVEGAGLQGVVVATLAAETIVVAINVWLTFRSFKLAASVTMWRAMFGYGIPFLPHRILATGMVHFGQYITRSMLGLHQAGLYHTAMRISMPTNLVVGAVQTSWVPIKFQIHAEDADPAASFRSLVCYYMAGISYLWIGVSVWGPEMVRVMATPPFHDALYLVPALALIPVSRSLYFMFGTGFEFSASTKTAPIASGAGLLTVVVLAFGLVPLFGAAGAALATMGGWLASAYVIHRLAQSRFRIDHDWVTLRRFAICSVVLVLLSMSVQGSAAWIRLTYAVAACIVYPVAVFLILRRSPSESDRMTKVALAVAASCEGVRLRWRGEAQAPEIR
jgi:O-antigen/teichoic acid export membrane protein